MTELFDELQDARAEHNLETGDGLGAREFYLTFLAPSAPPGAPHLGESTNAPGPLDDPPPAEGAGGNGAISPTHP